MAYNAALNTVYNYYLTTYAPKGTSQYDTHKKSELRNIYNSIVKLNKESPLYLMDTSRETREFAVGLKENARLLRNTIASLGGLDEDEMFNKKAAYSSNEDLVSASFIGETPDDGSIPSFNIEVTALASNQVNLGAFLPSDEKITLSPDAYSFDITINDLSYEFQYNIHEGETNRDLQERLSRLITNADIGVTADILEDEKGNSSLRLTSASSGLKDHKDYIFHVTDDKTSKKSGTVDYLGLAFMSRMPSNAEFILNGEPRSASSNHFTIDKKFELTLNRISQTEGESAEIGLKTDLDSLTENIGNLVNGYNSFIKAASEYLDLHPKSRKLLNEMTNMSRLYQPSLEQLGFEFKTDGQLSLNDSHFKQSVLNDEGHQQISSIRDFTNSVLRKTNQISLNPMEYVDKTIVAYKNPGHNFVAPYVTSNYSGMLFNSYC
ncbi:MAG: flagellar capping protein [Bacillota bacterium]|nr:flagellar capping protein [Bacillota bacterium]